MWLRRSRYALQRASITGVKVMLDRGDERFERVPFSLDAEWADDSKLTTDDDRTIQVFIEKVRRAIQALER